MPAMIIRIFKSWNTVDERNSWSNVYEIDGGTALVPNSEPATVIAEKLLAAEREIHLTPVQFWKIIISTWSEDSQPYNPNSFRTIPLEVAGLRTTVSQAVDGNVTYYVRRAAGTGRYGRLFYRGCLHEGDIETGGDLSSKLSANSSLNGPSEDYQAYRAHMVPLFEGATLGGRLALIGEYPDGFGSTFWLSRNVTNLVAGGVVVNQRNHAWFDKASLSATQA